MSKHIFITLALLLTGAGMRAASEWIDVTANYITNPGFDGNSNAGWTIYANSGSRLCDKSAQEFWNGVWHIYQQTPLPNGHYRLSVQAYHRTGDYSLDMPYTWQDTEVTSLLYANEVSTPLCNVCSESLSAQRSGTWSSSWMSGVWYPNDMACGAYCFSRGMYQNQIEVDVTDGQLTFGILNEGYYPGNWTMLDNWRLEYYGEIVKVTRVQMSETSLYLALGEKHQLSTTIIPDNATMQRIQWESTDETIMTVDQHGMVTAKQPGSAYVYARATDGSGKKGMCLVNVSNNTEGLADLQVTEVMVANVDQFIDPSYNYGGWVELYNPSSMGVTLTGCWLSDDPADLCKAHISQPMAIPARGYQCLWFEHHDCYTPSQVDMKLDADGGTLYLSDAKGKLLLSQQYPPAVARCSYARRALGSTEWGMTAQPTPGMANDGVAFASERLEAPVVDHDSQSFGTTLTVCVNIPEGATLLYTTDGTTPTPDHAQVSPDGLFYPSSTTTYRFCLVADGYLPSPVVTRTYVYQDKAFDLPVMSVVTDPAHLFSDELGIFVPGINGRPGNGQSGDCNWNMAWERPANFEYLVDNQMVINQETHMERCGGWSRAWTPFSFKVKANKVYEGQNFLPYDFFPDKPYLKHKTLQIRNGGNDNTCRFKDPALQEIVRSSGIDIDCQAYQPAMHYINGVYAGVINVREPNNKHYVYANYGLDDTEIDQFEMSPDSGYVQRCGTYESMQRWYDLSERCADDAVYDEICQMVDIDEYCNYMAVEMYLGSFDWPQNNVKAFRPIMEGGRFRFVLFDLDGAFSTSSPFTTFENKRQYTFDSLYGNEANGITTGSHICKEIEVVTIFLNMLQNERFRQQFVDTYCLVEGSVFEPTRCQQIINELAQRVSPSMGIYNEFYGGTASPWSTANSLISSLNTTRQRSLINALRGYGLMHAGTRQACSLQFDADVPQASLTLNGLPVPTGRFHGYALAPVTLGAQAPAGYRFVGWKQVEGSAGTVEVLSRQALWRYYDAASLDTHQWFASTYDDASWSQGKAPLGYGKSNVATPMASNHSCYYMRTTFTLDQAPASEDAFTLDYTADDGFVVYVNGVEAGRYNMPAGSIGYGSLATTYAHDNPDTGTMPLDASLFRQGTNVIAVEVHNNDLTSSDIFWEASLRHSSTATVGDIVSREEQVTLESPDGQYLQACFVPMTPAEMVDAELSLAPVVINEVSAANSVNVNDYYKKDDWIELYNTTDRDIDLRGMYLTDKSDKPMKFRIGEGDTHTAPQRYVIPAHGYRIIWCSGRDDLGGELHAPFKLNNEDGKLVRIQAGDGSWADSLQYYAMEGDHTVGRYPDGGREVYLMPRTTIQRANQLGSYATTWEYIAPENPDDTGVMAAREGGMSIAYRGECLYVKSEDCPHVTLRLYTPAGAMVTYRQLQLETGHDCISVSALPAGVYVARATDGEGNECGIKFWKP